mgnify:CR=1 FL=1
MIEGAHDNSSPQFFAEPHSIQIGLACSRILKIAHCLGFIPKEKGPFFIRT